MKVVRDITKMQQDIVELNIQVAQILETGNTIQIDGAMVHDLEAIEINLDILDERLTRAQSLLSHIATKSEEILNQLP